MTQPAKTNGQRNHGNFLDAAHLQKGVTRFWLIRHALVEQNARALLYGSNDVPLCPDSLVAQQPMYEALAARLPREAVWFISPLSRTLHTAEAIQSAGYGATPLTVAPGFIEQSLGEWQGLAHGDLPARLTQAPPLFWPIAADETPPGGESMLEVCARVGDTMDGLAREHHGRDMVVVSHGGAIRAALAHVLKIPADTALHFSVQNLSVTIVEQHGTSWRIVTVNELPGV